MFFTLSIPLWAGIIENGGDVQFIDDYIKIKIVVSQIEVDELPQDINLPRVLLGGHFGLTFFGYNQSQILRERDSGSGTFYKYNDISSDFHPCMRMKTDVILSHVPDHRYECNPEGAYIIEEYVLYPASEDNLPAILILGGSQNVGSPE